MFKGTVTPTFTKKYHHSLVGDCDIHITDMGYDMLGTILFKPIIDTDALVLCEREYALNEIRIKSNPTFSVAIDNLSWGLLTGVVNFRKVENTQETLDSINQSAISKIVDIIENLKTTVRIDSIEKNKEKNGIINILDNLK